MAFSGIYTQRPIKTADDLKGLKMRVYDGTGLAFGEATGIAARKMPFSEVYPGHESRTAGLHVYFLGIRCGCQGLGST